MAHYGEFLKTMEAASGVVSSKMSPKFLRRKAFAVLSAGFLDVELPREVMNLTPREAKDMRRSVATDLQAAFARAFAAHQRGDYSAEYHALFAAEVDPMWVALAATEWELVQRFEERRRKLAFDVVLQIVAAAVSSQQDAREVLETVRLDLLDDSGLDGGTKDMFAALGVGRHHALFAVDSVIRQ